MLPHSKGPQDMDPGEFFTKHPEYQVFFPDPNNEEEVPFVDTVIKHADLRFVPSIRWLEKYRCDHFYTKDGTLYVPFYLSEREFFCVVRLPRDVVAASGAFFSSPLNAKTFWFENSAGPAVFIGDKRFILNRIAARVQAQNEAKPPVRVSLATVQQEQQHRRLTASQTFRK